MRRDPEPKEMARVEWSLLTGETVGLRLGEGGGGAPPHTAKPAAAGSTPGARKGTATHLTEKRRAGRSPPPPKGSPRCTVLSPASFFGSLRVRADNYMSKWHSPFRARGGDPSARRAWGREGDWRVARAVHRFPSAGDRVSDRRSRAGNWRRGSVYACMRVGEGARVCARGAPGRTVQLFPRVILGSLVPSSLSFSLVGPQQKGRGEKVSQKS